MYVVANQLELSGGMRRDRGVCLVDAELYMPPSAIQKKGTLYIITEIEGAPSNPLDQGGQSRTEGATVCAETQMVILQEYYNFTVSATITSALRHALEVANQKVFNRNSAMLPPERRGLGVTCAVVRGKELYLAQMAPTQAFLNHQGQLIALPSQAPLEENLASRPLTPNPTSDSPRRSDLFNPLGRHSNIEPLLSHHLFEESDLLVLCSTSFAEQLNNEQAENFFLNQEDNRAVLYRLADFARSFHLTDGYVLTVEAKADYASNQTKNLQAGPVKPEESRLRSSVEGVAASVSLFTSKFAARNRNQSAPAQRDDYVYEDMPPRLIPKNVRSPQPGAETWSEEITSPRQPPANPLEPLLADDQLNDPWLRREEDNLEQPPYLRNRKPSSPPDESPAPTRDFTYNGEASPKAEHLPPKTTHSYSPPLPSINEEPEQVWGTSPLKPKRRFGWGKKSGGKLLGRLETTPANSPYVDLVGVKGYDAPPLDQLETQKLDKIANGKRWWLTVGLVALLVVAVLFLLFAVIGAGGGNSKALELVKAAEQKRGQAGILAATNPAEARKLIEQAKVDLAAAAKEKPNLPDIASVQNGLKLTLDNINRVVIPSDLRLAVDLTSQGTDVRLTQAVLSPVGDMLYLMDTGRGTIYAADLIGSIKPILKTGDPAGGAVFGKPVAMTSRQDSILVLDDQNICYIYNPSKGDWAAVKLGGTGGWTRPVRQIATYQGNLYLVGPVGSQILKYNSGAYSSTPDEWLNPVTGDGLKLDQISAMSIDGTIFTISKEGRMLQLARPSGKPKGEVQADYDLNAGERVGPPLNSPRTLQVGALDYPYAFVADGEKRVLQFQKEGGGFVQQFRSLPNGKEFDNLCDVAMDTFNKKLYLIGEQKVYVFHLPTETVGPVISATISGGLVTPVANLSPKPTPTFNP